MTGVTHTSHRDSPASSSLRPAGRYHAPFELARFSCPTVAQKGTEVSILLMKHTSVRLILLSPTFAPLGHVEHLGLVAAATYLMTRATVEVSICLEPGESRTSHYDSVVSAMSAPCRRVRILGFVAV